MKTEEMYITIAGINNYYGDRPFEIGSLLVLHKEPDNFYDTEAIVVKAPLFEKVGYVANSSHSVVKGCMSAGRILEKIPNECAAIVCFVSANIVIAKVLPDKTLKVKVKVCLISCENPLS